MHVLTGGSYNGKAAWVQNFYGLEDRKHIWISAYRNEPCPEDMSDSHTSFTVLEGVEQWILQAMEKDPVFDREMGRRWIESWIGWKRDEANRELVVIGTDISKGIVPIEAKDRLWRDMTGWFYQDLAKACSRFDVVWYGIGRRLK